MSDSLAVFPRSFVLRISREEWFQQVFTIKKYFPGIGRRWESEGVIFMAKKAEKGDSFVGYGVLEKFVRRNELSDEQRLECEKMGWKGVLIFSELYKFEPPLPIKETALSGTNARGRCLHGYPLTQKLVESILEKAKEKSSFSKID